MNCEEIVYLINIRFYLKVMKKYDNIIYICFFSVLSELILVRFFCFFILGLGLFSCLVIIIESDGEIEVLDNVCVVVRLVI